MYTLTRAGLEIDMGDSDQSSCKCNGRRSQEDHSKEIRTQDTKVEFSEDEEMLIARMFKLVGKRWSLIAGRIPGRTAEEIEKYWTSRHSSQSHSTRNQG